MSRILVIDDSHLVSNLLKEGLEQAGYEVGMAADANQGFLTALQFRPDLILLDVHLPDATGFDLCRVLRNRDEIRDVPIIMITGSHISTEHKVKGFQTGADDYLTKPFEFSELLERVRALLRRTSSSRRAAQSAMPGAGIGSVMGASTAKGKPPVVAAPVNYELKDILRWLLLDPAKLPPAVRFPRLGSSYLIVMMALALAGVAMTAGDPIKPLVAGLWIAMTWGLCVAALVMSCSIMGMHLSWKEGAGIAALAGVPILFKAAGGVVIAATTSLSPFFFSASPILVSNALPASLARLDLFEVWSVLLLWSLLRNRPKGNVQRSTIATIVVWATAAGMAMVLAKLIKVAA